MSTTLPYVADTLHQIDSAGLRKEEHAIDTPQTAHIALADGK